MEDLTKEKSKLMKIVFVFVIIVSAYFAVKIFSEIKKDNMLGESTQPATISFSGHGEVTAVPDLATISFTLTDTEKDLATAQNKVTAKETAVLAFLNSQSIAKADIKTQNYSSYPQYQYLNSVCPPVPMNVGTSENTVISSPYYCPPGKQVLTGYQVSENVSVTIHDITKSGAIVQGIGAVGVNDMSGPNFSIDKQDAFQEQARKIAIDDAKAKAKTLSSDLGVNLVRVVNFSENGNSPMPIMYAQGMALDKAPIAAPAPALPTGENKITSDVTITYEIR